MVETSVPVEASVPVVAPVPVCDPPVVLVTEPPVDSVYDGTPEERVVCVEDEL